METTAKNKIFNLIILDKSGSMSSIEEAAIAGFNETLGGIQSAQKQFADTKQHFVSLLPFCACSMEYVYDCSPAESVKKLTHREYQPCCCTPLYDAMGHGINDMLRKTQDDKDASVIVTVITDGMENASHEYSGAAIKALVDKMRDQYGWNFAYIGTNQDVESVAAKLSITNTMYFEDTSEGMREAWEKERKARHRMYSRIENISYACCESAAPVEKAQSIRNMLKENVNYRNISEFKQRTTPDRIDHLSPNQIFVFGSNSKGIHDGGAAYLALNKFGAVPGQGSGLQGNSYAIPTMDGMRALSIHVRDFIRFANQHPELTFLVTRIGCGTAGLTPAQVAPLFAGAVDMENIWLPADFWQEII